MDCFAEPVIGPRFRADPLARNDDGERGRVSHAAPFPSAPGHTETSIEPVFFG